MGTAYDDNGVSRGLTPADFAILMRSTRQVEQDGKPRHAAFTAALEALGIPFSLEAGGGPFDRPQTPVLRSTFELLRNTPLDRTTVQQHFNSQALPAYPDADFNLLVRILTDWNRRIHRPRARQESDFTRSSLFTICWRLSTSPARTSATTSCGTSGFSAA